MKAIAPFGYYGGKGKFLDFIINNVPAKNVDYFIDVFGGSGVVALSMVGKYRQVVYNDVNRRLTNFFKTLQQYPEEVMDALALTPSSEIDFEECWEESDDPIEDARRVFVRINCSFMKKGLWSGPGGWQFHGLTRKRSTAGFLRGQIAKLPAVAAVLKSLVIVNKDWRSLVSTAKPGSVIFADPPYDLASRSGGRGYKDEMTEKDHRDLCEMLSSSPAEAIVCGYHSDLYDELYAQWRLVERPIVCNYQATQGKSSSKRVECLWVKPSLKWMQRQ